MDYNNFTLKERCFVDEINSECMYYIHNRTKSRVIFIKNNDEQKSFMIGFNTPINDSTGIAHVVEHAVLSGSKKYPSDRAFVSIAKRSMNNIHLAFLHRISSLPVLSDASELILILYLQSLILSLYYPPEAKMQRPCP